MAKLIAKTRRQVLARATRLNTIGSLVARALIFAKAGNVAAAGRALVKAANEDEEIFDEISEAVADGVEEAVEEEAPAEGGAEEDDIEFEGGAEEDDIEFEGGAECDDEEEEKEDDETATEGCDSVEVPASVSRLARRMKNNRY